MPYFFQLCIFCQETRLQDFSHMAHPRTYSHDGSEECTASSDSRISGSTTSFGSPHWKPGSKIPWRSCRRQIQNSFFEQGMEAPEPDKVVLPSLTSQVQSSESHLPCGGVTPPQMGVGTHEQWHPGSRDSKLLAGSIRRRLRAKKDGQPQATSHDSSLAGGGTDLPMRVEKLERPQRVLSERLIAIWQIL